MSGVLGGRSFRAIGVNPRPMVFEYLASVVLNRQTEELRQFLLDTSLLPVLSAQICDNVLRTDKSQQQLERLVSEGLFISRSSDSPPTYEYHPLFREFLRVTKKAIDAASYAEILRRGAEYLESQSSIEGAVALLLSAGDSKRAMEVAEEHCREVYEEGHYSTLLEWVEEFRQQLGRDSELRILAATSLLSRGDYGQAQLLVADVFGPAKEWAPTEIGARGTWVMAASEYSKGELASAARWLTEAEEQNNKPRNWQLHGLCARYRALLAVSEGRLADARNLAVQAVEVATRSGNSYDAATSLQTLALVEVGLGNLAEAGGNTERALEEYKSAGSSPYRLALAVNDLAFIHHLLGNFEEALASYSEAHMFAKRAASKPTEALVLLGQADVFNDLNQTYQAAELYGRALEVSTKLGDAALTAQICLTTSVLHRRHGSASVANEWLKRASELAPDQRMTAKVRLQMAALEMNVSPANAIQTALEVLREGRPDKADEVFGHYCMAVSSFNLGEFELAARHLEGALRIAGLSGMEQVLVSELGASGGFEEFVRAQQTSMPTLAVVITRIETMRAISRTYGQETESEAKPKEDLLLDAKAFGRGEFRGFEGQLEELKPQARELLFFLLDRKGADKTKLLEVFWPDFSAGRQTANLHMAVYSLRNVLGKQGIELDGVAYYLSPGLPIRYDVEVFERSAGIAENLAPGDPRLLFVLGEAIKSYKGAFLQSFESEWVIARRRALEIRYLDLVAEYADEALVRDQPERAVRTIREELLVDPYRDDLNIRDLELLVD